MSQKPDENNQYVYLINFKKTKIVCPECKDVYLWRGMYYYDNYGYTECVYANVCGNCNYEDYE